MIGCNGTSWFLYCDVPGCKTRWQTETYDFIEALTEAHEDGWKIHKAKDPLGELVQHHTCPKHS